MYPGFPCYPLRRLHQKEKHLCAKSAGVLFLYLITILMN